MPSQNCGNLNVASTALPAARTTIGASQTLLPPEIISSLAAIVVPKDMSHREQKQRCEYPLAPQSFPAHLKAHSIFPNPILEQNAAS
jgi:hypothetical protein